MSANDLTVAVMVPAPPQGFAWDVIPSGDGFRLRLIRDGFRLRLIHREQIEMAVAAVRNAQRQSTELEAECPPCKLLLNSGGLIGIVRGINRMIKRLNSRGKDLQPEVYADLEDVICGAHEKLAAIEPGLAQGPFVEIKCPFVEIK